MKSRNSRGGARNGGNGKGRMAATLPLLRNRGTLRGRVCCRKKEAI